jgi:dihydropteroate synthase
MIWQVKGRKLGLDARTLIMGILNVTPDSFSDGGKFLGGDDAVGRARKMLKDGADIIDIGGESSRPGSDPVPVEEELRRVVPVVDRLWEETGAVISVDTTKARVAEEAVRAGASIINDISALRFDPRMAEVAAKTGAGLVLMHMKGTPADMQKNPEYGDLMKEVAGFLDERGKFARNSGVVWESIVYDPGIGFGKTVEHNLQLLNRLGEMKSLMRPMLAGPSRKSFIGAVLDLPVEERLEGTAAAVALAIANGASIVRVHDVREMSRVARIADAIKRAGSA